MAERTDNLCACTCHCDPEIILCGQCKDQHGGLDKVMLEAESVTFMDDEAKRRFLQDWCATDVQQEGR